MRLRNLRLEIQTLRFYSNLGVQSNGPRRSAERDKVDKPGLTPGHYVVRLHGVDTYNPVEFDYEGEPEVILSLEPSEAGF